MALASAGATGHIVDWSGLYPSGALTCRVARAQAQGDSRRIVFRSNTNRTGRFDVNGDENKVATASATLSVSFLKEAMALDLSLGLLTPPSGLGNAIWRGNG